MVDVQALLAAARVVPLLITASMLGAASADQDSRFVTESDAAMARMMTDMSVKPSGDVDRDFVATMVPHHQGAIDMAVAMLKYGRNEQLKRIAQEIIVGQQQEIAAMRLALGQPLPPSAPAPTQGSDGALIDGAAHHDGMIRRESRE